MDKLNQVLAQEDTVLFIGSGISMWSGLPSWSGMIEELARFVEAASANADLVRAEAQKGDLLQAASYGFDKLTKQQIGEFIRTACRYGIAKPHEIHRKIVSLGPRCFVTTNYDDLIEQSLRKWQPDRFFRPPVTNRHLTETAEIMHARAIDFVFKPHGDAADCESIILTREQYRQLLPHGERQAALESLKMLLASRPVVYLGFGLRDPDFIYVRDLLANIYKGGARDHYAIMADVSDAESDYWRRNYGIHLISYSTTERPDNSRDHTALLTFLDSLLGNAPVPPAKVGFNPSTPDVVLTIARYAAGLARTPKLTPEFQIRVHAEAKKRSRIGLNYRPDRFDHLTVDKFLGNGPDRAILIGLPGAGKTYSLRRAAAFLAEELHDTCLSDPFDSEAVVLPILADLKLYRGNLRELVSQTLPKSLQFDEVIRCFKVKIFLDSFNEMPQAYLESGSYESDFVEFTTSIGDAALVIASRTSDGLSKLRLPTYYLDQIDDETVTVELQRLGIEIESRFEREVRQLLQRPFYFQYVARGAVRLSREAHPRDFYQVFFENLRKAFVTRFGGQIEIEKSLSLAAYNAHNRGEEAFPLSELLRVLKTGTESVGLTNIDVRDVANWLVSSSVLVPYSGGRVAFVHQSVTEYLAATELARRYQSSPDILKEKLLLRRWDQTLYMTLSLLPPEDADVFLQDVITADFTLALRAAKYIEVGREEVVAKILNEIPERIKESESLAEQIAWILESSLPISEIHEPQIRSLMKLGNMIGGAAAKRLAELKGVAVKQELMQLLIEARDDYNYCRNGIAPALKPFITNDDVHEIVVLADSIQDEVTLDTGDEVAEGFISAVGALLAELDISIIKQELLPEAKTEQIPEIRARIICDMLWHRHSTAALNLAGELLLRGINQAATAIYFISNFARPEHGLSWASFTFGHADRLVSMVESRDNKSWSLEALKCLCEARPDLIDVVSIRTDTKSGIEKAALLYCVDPENTTPMFEAMAELVSMSTAQCGNEQTHLLEHIELDWAGHEPLFVQLLKLRDKKLALALLNNVYPDDDWTTAKLEIGAIDWWLDWMLEPDDPDSQYWFYHLLGWFLGHFVNDETRRAFVIEFNKPGSKFRRLLLDFVLPNCSDLTTEEFNEDSISFMLADLSQEGSVSSFGRHLLCTTATEHFVTERLLPLLPDAEQPLLRNLHEVLIRIGTCHGRRYLLE